MNFANTARTFNILNLSHCHTTHNFGAFQTVIVGAIDKIIGYLHPPPLIHHHNHVAMVAKNDFTKLLIYLDLLSLPAMLSPPS